MVKSINKIIIAQIEVGVLIIIIGVFFLEALMDLALNISCCFLLSLPDMPEMAHITVKTLFQKTEVMET